MKYLITTIAAVLVVGCGPSVDIWEAAKKGNIEAVKQHLAAGTVVNAIDDDWTPLKYAAHEGHKEVVELLIAEGAGVNTKTDDGWTPLILAAIKGHKEIVDLLIANGADVNAKDEIGGALHSAALEGHKEIVELLITKDADVNAKNEDGETPLDWAINFKQTEVADLLRKHGGKRGKELKAAGN